MTGAFDLVALLLAFAVLAAYARGGRMFDIANVVVFVPLTLHALSKGAYPAAFISTAFGLIAIYHLIGANDD